MWCPYFWVLVLTVWVSGGVAQLFTFPFPRVELADGVLRGKYVLSRESRKVRAFLGIPYAKPPVDELRFKSPEPAEPWAGDRWAVDHPKPCVQPDSRHGEPVGQEDCLYLNVYTLDGLDKRENPHPLTRMGSMHYSADDIKSNEIPERYGAGADLSDGVNMSCPLLPVIVFFHGGSFEMGRSEPFTQEYFLDFDVVLVTVQYRLGMLGFLSTGDDVLPGNLGFKDQRLALKWVQENIEHFGGCPEKVTIVGDGAGGASVHYHMLFSHTKNAPLFRAGISMSGTALSPWAFRPPAEVKHTVERLAAIAKCPKKSQEFITCLQAKPAEDFVKLLQKYKNETRGGCSEWAMAPAILGGVLESNDSEDAFITANPWDKKIILPWVVGVTSKELLYEFTPQLVDRKNKQFKELDKCFDKTLPVVLGFKFSNASDAELASEVRSFYFKNKPISREKLADVVDAVSDGSVVYPAFESVRRAGRRSTWLYFFDYIGANTYGPSALDGRIAPGRGDDLFYFFPRPLGKNVPRRTKDPDTVLSRKMVKFWTNFVTNLDPTPVEVDGVKWVSVAPSTSFLNITQQKLSMARPFMANRMSFWYLRDFPIRNDNFEDFTDKPVSEAELPAETVDNDIVELADLYEDLLQVNTANLYPAGG